MAEGALLSALQNRLYANKDDAMSVDEMKHLLILMGTITVISFVLVVSVVTVLIVFIW